MRWIWRGETFKIYSYHQNRGTQVTGEELIGVTGPIHPDTIGQVANGVPLLTNVDYDLKMIIDAANGTIQGYVNDVLEIDATGLDFGNANYSNVLLFGGWHGGGTDDWSPSATTEFYVKDVLIT